MQDSLSAKCILENNGFDIEKLNDDYDDYRNSWGVKFILSVFEN